MIEPMRDSTRRLLSEITEFLDDLQSLRPMQGVEGRNDRSNRQKLLVWLEDALGVLCGTLADIDEGSVLDQFRTTICESVDGVLLALVDAMESDDEMSWDLARRLTGDRCERRRKIRGEYREGDPPLQDLELIHVRNCSPGGSTGYSLSWLRQSTAFPCRAMVVATSGL